MSRFFLMILLLSYGLKLSAQNRSVTLKKDTAAKKVDVQIGGKLFTSFLYPDSLEKPVLYPLYTAKGTIITRGFPLKPRSGEPTDHPHHVGLWLNFENVNGLDFWNNSYAIPEEKKHLYGRIKTIQIMELNGEKTGSLAYQAHWLNQREEVLLEESTRYDFSGNGNERIIDRTTTLKAITDVTFKDAKDGLIAIRLARELQIPSEKEEVFKDDKGIKTLVKAVKDGKPNGNYVSSEGKTGNAVWSTRAKWVKVYGKMGLDSVSVVIIDHPQNVNFPTYWHARGYGLFAANPLGENIFSNGKITKNLHLNKGEKVTFKYRIVIDEHAYTLPPERIEALATEFAKK